jgi:hypothetical protein
MFTHTKSSHHTSVDQHAANLSSSDPADMFDQDAGQAFLPTSDQFGTGTFGLDAGASFAPPGALTVLSPGISAMAVPASGLPASSSVTVSTAGSGLVFDNTYAASCSAQFEGCIVAAEQQLESLFSNSDTINVTFQEVNQGNDGNALNNNSSGYLYSYAQVRAALLKEEAPNDVLPTTDPSGGSKEWYVPEAYGRMLGLTTATGAPDLTLTLNSYYNWDFGQDIINGVTHELSEGGMGRIGDLGQSGSGYWGTMDLFRYNSAGQLDESNGRDGQTTYFSSNGGATLSDQNLAAKGAPTLSFNNQYNSNGTLANTGDTADWTQEAVFGSTGTGETLALTQTELDVMQALGWHLSLKQDVFSGSGTWETPTGWSTGSMPIEAQDAYIASGIVSLDSNVIVNSIATGTGGLLNIGDSSATTLTAVDGTNLNTEDTSSTASGNLGTIDVHTGSALQVGYFSETFDNAGTILLGKGAGGSGAGDLNIAGTVDLSGGGTLTLGQTGTGGDILNAPGLSGSGLVNVNNTISGNGVIDLGSFDNQADGTLEAQSYLQINAGTFTNEGIVTDEANATLQLGANGATQSLDNTGTVAIDAGGDLAVSGAYTVSGSGEIGLKGAGAAITSDGAPATFTNASTIDAFYTSGIGDADLTFDNSGSLTASGSGVTLTIDTGLNNVVNTGTMTAESSAVLTIASDVINQGTLEAGTASSMGTLDLGQDDQGASFSADNTGLILVDPGSDLAISGNYEVAGSGEIYLKGAGAITSDGAGPATFLNASTIEAFGNNQIGDVGLKSANDLAFSNSGTVAATGLGVTLTIDTGAYTVTNSGTLAAVNAASLSIVSNLTNQGIVEAGTASSSPYGATTGTVDLGLDGGTASATNTGAINVYAGSDLAISGNYAVSGSGSIALKGAGADITSDGTAPATFTNASEIEALGTDQIGDVGIKSANDLTFVNTGSVIATLSGTELTINTGANAVNDSGGLLEAVNSAVLVIDSNVNTGKSGTIEANAFGTVTVNGAVSGSGTLSSGSVDTALLDLSGGGTFAGAISGTGTVEFGGVTTLDAGAKLSAADVVETSSLTLANVGVSNGAGDIFTMTASSGETITLGRTGSGSFTNAGTLLANGAGTAVIAAPVVDNGAILVTSGMLEVTGKLSGSGSLIAGAGAVAYLTAGGALTEAISGAGMLELGGAYTLAGGDVTAATVEVNAARSLSGNGTLAGALIDKGSVASSGGELLVGGALSGNGTLSAGAGTVLDLAAGGSFGGAISGAGTVAIGGATTLSAGAKLLAADVSDTANLKLANVAVTNASGDIFDLAAASATTVTLSGSGTGAFTNAGSLVANGPGNASINAPFTNSGTVSAVAGTLAFLGNVAGTGTLDVGSAGTLSLGLGAASGQTVDFLASSGVLDLSHPLDFLGKIAGFGGSDQIFLANTTFTTFAFSNNLLTVNDGGATVASLNITESSNLFTLTNENHGVLIKF